MPQPRAIPIALLDQLRPVRGSFGESDDALADAAEALDGRAFFDVSAVQAAAERTQGR